MKKIIAITALALSLISTSVFAASLETRITSNECNGDFSIKLAKHGSSGTTDHYSAFSSKAFTRASSCVIKARVTVPAGYKIKTQDIYARGSISATTGTTSEVLYGLSVKSADDRVYSGTSSVYRKNQNISTGSTFKRGTGTTCGQPIDLIIRHDASVLKGTGKVTIDYHAFYVDMIKC